MATATPAMTPLERALASGRCGMTEGQYRDCRRPLPLLRFLRRRATPRASYPTDRLLRLWAVGCVRRVWHLVKRPASRAALETAELFADGAADAAALAAAARAAITLTSLRGRTYRAVPNRCAAACAAEAKYAARSVCEHRVVDDAVMVGLLRCVTIDPFRPAPALNPAWVTPAARAVAEQAYQDRDFTGLPILADMLEDAGCADAGLLEHLRGPGPHCRGCHALDLVLGRR